MKKAKLFLVFGLMVILFTSGCTFCREYAPKKVCVSTAREKVPCLSEIRYYVSINYTDDIDVTINGDDMCYDFENDPDDLREKVEAVMEEHPNDWELYMDWTPHKTDPIITLIEDESIKEPIREDIFNHTKIIDVCIKDEIRYVCVR